MSDDYGFDPEPRDPESVPPDERGVTVEAWRYEGGKLRVEFRSHNRGEMSVREAAAALYLYAESEPETERELLDKELVDPHALDELRRMADGEGS